jgi:capsular exopolysaccharide synthesis family protein
MVRSYAAIFENLCLRAGGAEAPAMVVTATARGDGCSTVACNAALCAAGLGGYRTLLVDADPDRAGASSLLKASKQAGLVELLAGQADPADCFRPIENTNLTFLAAGQGTGGDVAARSTRLEELMGEWRRRYDWVVIDTPPVLQSAVPAIIGRKSSGALIVLRARRTRGEVLDRAASELRRAEVPTLGAVLNRRRFTIPRGPYRRL